MLYSFQNDVGGFLVEVLFYLEAVCPASAVCGGKQGCSATGAGVDDDISGVGEYLDETGKQGDGFLAWVYLGCRGVSGEVETVEDHRPVVVELGEFVAVEQDAVLAVADNLHIGFEDLGGEVFTEYEVDVMFESVFATEFDILELLLELAENHHARRFACLFRLFDEHLGAEVHELGWAEIVVGVEECPPGLVAFSFLVVAVDVP